MKTFKLPPEKSPDERVSELFEEIAKLLQVGFHDGNLRLDADVWQQNWKPLQNAWSRLTVPSNVDALRRRLGTASNPDWQRMIEAAYDKSLERSQITD
jgi:hypothetical protein